MIFRLNPPFLPQVGDEKKGKMIHPCVRTKFLSRQLDLASATLWYLLNEHLEITMEKRKRLQQFVILAVLFLTVYNILPTIFFYTKPLKREISEESAGKISSEIITRINQTEEEAQSWLSSFCKLLHLKPQSITLDEQNPQHILVTFKNTEDASAFKRFLPRAGSLISFVPSQLDLYDADSLPSKTVKVQRKIPLHFDEANGAKYFQYSKKFDGQNFPTSLYRALTFDRVLQLAIAASGQSEHASLILAANGAPVGHEQDALVLQIAQDIVSANKILKHSDSILKRYYATFSQTAEKDPTTLIREFAQTIEQTKDQIKLQRIQLQSEEQALQAKGNFLETTKKQRLELLLTQESTLSEASRLLSKHKAAFSQGKSPYTFERLNSLLEQSYVAAREKGSKLQLISFDGRNPFFESLTLDWDKETITLNPHADLQQLKTSLANRGQRALSEQVDQMLYNEVALSSRLSGEKITPVGTHFAVHLGELQGSDGFLAMRLSEIASARASSTLEMLQSSFKPKHTDLKREVFPIMSYETYQAQPAHEKKLGLVVYAPATRSELPIGGLNNSSIYVLAKGLDKIIQKLQVSEDGEDAKLFFDDFQNLKNLLQKNGLFGYPGTTLTSNREFANDFIFEAEEFYLPVLHATREDFHVYGTKRYAVLELTNNQQRLLTQNRIEDQMHEQLLKWRDDYHAAKLGIGGSTAYDVPKPTKNPLVDNVKLSIQKYFRGDNRKVLNWGLDLSGGKTVQVELRDQTGKIVTGDEEIKQGINELYERVNKMGVSEVSIRREGNLITLDFPGSQDLSAHELIKASTMYFHIVNEKFNEKNPSLAEASSQFLQDIWNEAVVTGRKSAEEINQIAWRHIHGDSMDPDFIQPRSEAARLLYENGLRLASPLDHTRGNLFDDAISMIAIQRGEDFTEWNGKTHPLMIVFRNYAIEGSHLKNVTAGYDQNKGNLLSFEIRGKETTKSGEKINPRADLYAWTSQFSKDKIAGTPNATYSGNEGFRMAVVLNGSIITSPTLNFPIRDNASIEGSFTAREVNQLEADLKAGSLSFAPRILSEKNVSPELGVKERTFGIGATLLALVLVVGCMIAYYRFGGFIASIAVVVNLLIMWATLQNLGATLTLASIAGGILTLGMAVDANVLVFERIREEFALSGRLASSVQAGYRKAFSAIVDSNITTIIAAIILMQFDSGPIKGFAITLIIGIASSMFTALFMTRYFFTGWVSNAKRTQLKMSQAIKAVKFPFLKYAKLALSLSTLLILAGGYLFVKEKGSILGMDFTGGYALNFELVPSEGTDYRNVVEKALTGNGANGQDIQVRGLTPPHHIRLFLGKGMGEEGKPFYNLPLQFDAKDAKYKYESNPRINWVVSSLEKAGVALSADSLETLDQNWSEISGQLSDSMRNSALLGLGIAILCILAYITIRFEFTYAVSATLCLAHDIAITLAAIAALHFFGVPIQIDLNTVAALMTIVGYSLNDTIIVFDRIREDRLKMRKSSFAEIINHALNVTLSRTVMTSMTTLLVLLPLVLLGGSTIFAFSLVMIIGVIFGTLSSLFIAAPMLRYFHSRRESKATAPQIVRQ